MQSREGKGAYTRKVRKFVGRKGLSAYVLRECQDNILRIARSLRHSHLLSTSVQDSSRAGVQCLADARINDCVNPLVMFTPRRAQCDKTRRNSEKETRKHWGAS